jgi:glycosyltransferase involved in cell wall biosynthesis
VRILHVIDTDGPGGAETLFAELCRRFDRDGHSSVAVCGGGDWLEGELRRQGVDVRPTAVRGSFRVDHLAALARLAMRERIDVIHAHLLGPATYCAIAGTLARRPVVATFHGAVDVPSHERMMALKAFAIRRLSHVVCVSEQLRVELCGRLRIPDSRTSVVYNGIDTAHFSPEAGRRRFTGPLVLRAVGNIRLAKDYATAIRTVAALVRRNVALTFEVAGEGHGRLREELEQLVRELGVERQVRFLGFVSDVRGFLRGADVFLLSSRSEGLPFALLQALATGVPVVATRCGVEAVVEHERTALLTPVGDHEALAASILRLAGDHALAEAFAGSGRRLVESQYSIDATVSAYAGLYRQVRG